jgi:hypothetical protein
MPAKDPLDTELKTSCLKKPIRKEGVELFYSLEGKATKGAMIYSGEKAVYIS